MPGRTDSADLTRICWSSCRGSRRWTQFTLVTSLCDLPSGVKLELLNYKKWNIGHGYLQFNNHRYFWVGLISRQWSGSQWHALGKDLAYSLWKFLTFSHHRYRKSYLYQPKYITALKGSEGWLTARLGTRAWFTITLLSSLKICSFR